jgi:hypothetical protein
MTILDNAVSMHQGHVLNFSDRTFAEFFDAELGVDIDHSRYHKFGSSKARGEQLALLIAAALVTATSARGWWRRLVPKTTRPATVPSRGPAGNDPAHDRRVRHRGRRGDPNGL